MVLTSLEFPPHCMELSVRSFASSGIAGPGKLSLDADLLLFELVLQQEFFFAPTLTSNGSSLEIRKATPQQPVTRFACPACDVFFAKWGPCIAHLKAAALDGAHAALAGRRGKQEACSAHALLLLARRSVEERGALHGEFAREAASGDDDADVGVGAFSCDVARQTQAGAPMGSAVEAPPPQTPSQTPAERPEPLACKKQAASSVATPRVLFLARPPPAAVTTLGPPSKAPPSAPPCSPHLPPSAPRSMPRAMNNVTPPLPDIAPPSHGAGDGAAKAMATSVRPGLEQRRAAGAVSAPARACKFFDLGYCRSGANCRYAHEPTQQPPKPGVAAASSISTCISSSTSTSPYGRSRFYDNSCALSSSAEAFGMPINSPYGGNSPYFGTQGSSAKANGLPPNSAHGGNSPYACTLSSVRTCSSFGTELPFYPVQPSEHMQQPSEQMQQYPDDMSRRQLTRARAQKLCSRQDIAEGLAMAQRLAVRARAQKAQREQWVAEPQPPSPPQPLGPLSSSNASMRAEAAVFAPRRPAAVVARGHGPALEGAVAISQVVSAAIPSDVANTQRNSRACSSHTHYSPLGTCVLSSSLCPALLLLGLGRWCAGSGNSAAGSGLVHGHGHAARRGSGRDATATRAIGSAGTRCFKQCACGGGSAAGGGLVHGHGHAVRRTRV